MNSPTMSKSAIIDRLLNPGIIAVIRANSSEQLIGASQALYEGGVTALEVTMTTPNALGVISDVSKRFGNKVLVGVGTVLDTETCRAAILAGAEYVVTPITRPEVIKMSHRYGVPITCGAYTPTEAVTAQESGADFVKIFPADQLGALYIKNILGPLPQLQIIPTGGVNLDTVEAFIKAGCVALGAGSSLVSKEILKNQDWKKLTETAAAFVEAIRKARA